MPSHQAQTPAAVTRAYPGLTEHPIIAEVFHTDGRGWRTLRGYTPDVDRLVRGGYRKRITVAYARKLRREGVAAVAVNVGGGRIADFTIRELVQG
jgi:hypothetical protein